MALRFVDGASGYDTVHGPQKWSLFGAPTTINPTNGRRGSPCIRIPNWDGTLGQVLTDQTTYIIGFAFRVSALPSVAKNLVTLYDNGFTNQCSIALNPSGTISGYRGNVDSGVVLGTSSATIVPNVYAYIEVKFTVDNTVGIINVRKDNILILALGGVDTAQSVNNTAQSIYFIQNITAEATTIDIDDLYILDGTGALNNAFLGDCRIDTMIPNGSGISTGWTPFGATPNFQNVDDGIVNDDADYNSASGIGPIDTYNFPDIALPLGPIAGVVLNLTVRRDDAVDRIFNYCVKTGVATTATNNTHCTNSYVRYSKVYETDFNTSAPWDLSGLNLAQFGIKSNS